MKVIKPKSYEELLDVLQQFNVNPHSWHVVETRDCYLIEPNVLLYYQDTPVIVVEKLRGLWDLFYYQGFRIFSIPG